MSTYKYRGKWRYEFVKSGKRTQGWWFETKKEAKAAEAEARKQLEALKVTNTGFLDLCTARLDDLKGRKSHSHFVKNQRLFKNLMVIWRTKKTVTRQDVESYLAWAATPRKKRINKNQSIMSGSNSLATRHLRLIKALFRYGMEVGIWNEDPTKGVKPYPGTQAARYVPPVEHIRKILESANSEQRAYLTVLVNTMARITAVNTLKWEDVHDDYLILRTRKAKNSNEKQIRIPINQTLKNTLAVLPRKSEYVFTSRMTGTHYVYRNNLMKILCKKAGVPHFTYHALRHFGASRLIQQGVPLTDVQQLLGHEKATTTAIYLRSVGDGVKEAVKKLEGI